jgi:hypothetical protein
VDIAWIIICYAQGEVEEALKTFENYKAKCNIKFFLKKILHAIVVELSGDLQHCIAAHHRCKAPE